MLTLDGQHWVYAASIYICICVCVYIYIYIYIYIYMLIRSKEKNLRIIPSCHKFWLVDSIYISFTYCNETTSIGASLKLGNLKYVKQNSSKVCFVRKK